MGKLISYWYYLREYFFPRGCGICGSMLFGKEETWYGLCGKCRAGIDLENAQDSEVIRCNLCGRPLVSEIERCLPCRENELPAYDRLIALFPYTGKYQKLLGSFKFSKSIATGNFLAEKLSKALKLLPLEEMENSVLVPVPPRPGKIRKTGWDQIVMLSKIIGKRNDVPKIRFCLKRQASQTQKKLDRKNRKTNLKGRIIAKGKVPLNCILFDDVITTGSTMDACAAALKSAGAEKVFGICLFYD